MKLDESARIGVAIAALLVTTFIASWLAGAAAAVAALVCGGLMLIVLNPYERDYEPIDVSPPTQASDEPQYGVADHFNAVADPLLLLSESRVIFANSAAKTVLGGHVEGQDLRLAMRHPAVATLLGRVDGQGVVEINGVGGTQKIWEVRIAPTVADMRIVQMVDRSARHAAERARVDFVANASHELRTPLANISGFVETLTDDSAGGDAAIRTRFLGIIASETKRLSALVEDLMSLSRIEADKGRAPDHKIDLRHLVERTVGERHQPVTVNLARTPCFVMGDEAQLSQLLHNLIDNAFKYGKPDGDVAVALERANREECSLRVSDQGIGISAEHLPRLTERFYRVDTARSQSAGGTGLGLSIVKHIAERHLARLEFSSEIGKGTTVSVTFPLAAE